jgi:hypothetical protein
MGDWADTGFDEYGGLAFLSTLGEGSPINDYNLSQGSPQVSSVVWPTANLAVWVPVMVHRPVTVYGFTWYNGATVSGNFDCGIFDWNFNRVASLGSTAQSGTSAAQSAALGTPASLNPGVYCLAAAADNATAAYEMRASLDAQTSGLTGCGQMASAFVLPSSLVWAAPVAFDVPLVLANLNVVY